MLVICGSDVGYGGGSVAAGSDGVVAGYGADDDEGCGKDGGDGVSSGASVH